jgi:hypothetical protein
VAANDDLVGQLTIQMNDCRMKKAEYFIRNWKVFRSNSVLFLHSPISGNLCISDCITLTKGISIGGEKALALLRN